MDQGKILDPKTRERLNFVYPDFAARVLMTLSDMRKIHGMSMRVTEGMRTWQAQEALYAKGRTAPGSIVTNSKPGDSIHHYGLAADCCFEGTDPYLSKHHRGEVLWREFGRIAKSHGLHWGGDWSRFVDRPHVQLSYGLSLAQIKALYQKGGLTAVWRKVDEVRGVKGSVELAEATVQVLGSPTIN